MGFEKCMGNWHSQFSLLHLSIFQQLYIISFQPMISVTLWNNKFRMTICSNIQFIKGIWPIGKKSDKTNTEQLRVLFKWYLWAVAKCISIVKLRFEVSAGREREKKKKNDEWKLHFLLWMTRNFQVMKSTAATLEFKWLEDDSQMCRLQTVNNQQKQLKLHLFC